MSFIIPIKVIKHAEDLLVPKHATLHSAGTDLIAAVTDSIVLNPQQRALIPTGLIMAIPQGYEGQIRPRSGLAIRHGITVLNLRSGLAIKHGITVLNSPGTIDSDYRNEVKVILINLGELPFEVTRGMRIAQLVIAKYQTVEFSTEPNIVKLSPIILPAKDRPTETVRPSFSRVLGYDNDSHGSTDRHGGFGSTGSF